MFDECNVESVLGAACGKFAGDIEYRARSLQFLAAIEETLVGLARAREEMREVLGDFQKALTELPRRAGMLDESGKLCDCLESCEAGGRRFISDLIARREAATTARELADDGPEILRAYDETITLAKQVHNVLTELRWAVIAHDATLEPASGKTFSSAGALREFLEADQDSAA